MRLGVSLILCAGSAAADPPGATPPIAAPGASTRYEVFGDGVLPIGGELRGFGVGVGPEVQVVRDDGDGRTLSAGVHFTVHRMAGGADEPSYVGGLALERHWGERSWWGFYWGLRLDGTAAFWQGSRAWGVAPGIVAGLAIPTGDRASLDIGVGVEIPIGQYDIVAGVRAGVSFAAL